MKGITTTTSIIVLLLITITLSGAVWTYINVYVTGLTAKQIVVIDSFHVSDGQVRIIVRNVGTGDIRTEDVIITDKSTGDDLAGEVVWGDMSGALGKTVLSPGEAAIIMHICRKRRCDYMIMAGRFVVMASVVTGEGGPSGAELCPDGTAYGECSSTKPKYCEDGSLVDQCADCGCDAGDQCQPDGTCVPILPDTTPPAAVTGLGSPDKGTDYVYWTWTDPPDADFAESVVYLDDVNVLNTSSGFYNATGLQPNTAYTVKIHTKDLSGNVNATDVTDTQVTTFLVNAKDSSKYSGKRAFLISDGDWRSLLSLVPVATWTGSEGWCKRGYGTPGDVCVYPLLVYHDESGNFDADSVIYFMQQYSLDNLTVVGIIPQNLADLLIAPPDLGAGLAQEDINFIMPEDYLSYWNLYQTVVYVEDDYELALLASAYASLVNAPLVVEGTFLDAAGTFAGKDVICAGSVSPAGTSCSEQYDLGQLRQHYLDSTGTDKIVLVNPGDLAMSINEAFTPEKSAEVIYERYGKVSLLAPVLAGAKRELILSTTQTQYGGVDASLESEVSALGMAPAYLTIMASPLGINATRPKTTTSLSQDYIEADNTEYGDLDGDRIPEMAVGRVYSITSSDVSSYLARVLFYGDIAVPEHNMTVTYQDENNTMFRYSALEAEKVYGDAGFDVRSYYDGLVKRDATCWGIGVKPGVTDLTFTNRFWNRYTCVWNVTGKEKQATHQDCYDSVEELVDVIPFGIISLSGECVVNFGFSPSFFHKDVILDYLDHSGTNGYMSVLNRYYPPYDRSINPKVVISDACLSCSFDKVKHQYYFLFCANVLRRGAVGHFGAIDVGYSDSFSRVLNDNFLRGRSLGEAIKAYYTGRGVSYKWMAELIPSFADMYNDSHRFFMLLGDPTFSLNLDSDFQDKIDINRVVSDYWVNLTFRFPETVYAPTEKVRTVFYTTVYYMFSPVSSESLYRSLAYIQNSTTNAYVKNALELVGEIENGKRVKNVDVTLVDRASFVNELKNRFETTYQDSVINNMIDTYLIRFYYTKSPKGYYYQLGYSSGGGTGFNLAIPSDKVLENNAFPAFDVEVNIELEDQ